MENFIGIKKLSLFQNWQVYFEENKEKIRQQEKITDNIFNKLNSRAGLIPYFNIILDDSKIKEENGRIYLGISLNFQKQKIVLELQRQIQKVDQYMCTKKQGFKDIF